jgi:hypothetical protein
MGNWLTEWPSHHKNILFPFAQRTRLSINICSFCFIFNPNSLRCNHL